MQIARPLVLHEIGKVGEDIYGYSKHWHAVFSILSVRNEIDLPTLNAELMMHVPLIEYSRSVLMGMLGL